MARPAEGRMPERSPTTGISLLRQLIRIGPLNREIVPSLPHVEPGQVWLVGAGPGDPGLLTLAGFHALLQADVVVHDRLGCEEILLRLPGRIERVDVGKGPAGESGLQQGINERLLSEARARRRVVRLKGGDPFVFGRGMEEVEFLRARGVEVHVVAGVSSALAGPAAAGIPVTHRALAHGFEVIAGRTEEGGGSPGGPAGSTRIYLMAMKALEEVTAGLLSRGDFLAQTPCAIIADATSYRQRVLVSTLGRVVEEARREGLGPPAVFCVGDAARFATAAPPAQQPVIVVTGTRVAPLLRDRFPGARFLWRPLVEMVAHRRGGEGIEAALASGWIVFNNPWSVRFFMELLLRSGADARSVRARLAAVGEETAAALEEHSLVADLAIAEGHREGIVETLAARMQGEVVTLPVAAGYQGALSAGLRQRGAAAVTLLPVYEARPRDPGGVDWACCTHVAFSSPLGVERFSAAWPGAPVERLTALCIGSAAARSAAGRGFSAVVNLTPAQDASMARPGQSEGMILPA